jgi:hypothetical protein
MNNDVATPVTALKKVGTTEYQLTDRASGPDHAIGQGE